MITGLINVARPGDADAIDGLADTLASLVTGVAAGLVGDAVIVSATACETLEAIAEGSGAALSLRSGGACPWNTGAKAARREWVLCLEAGDVLRDGWIRILDRFVGTARPDMTLGRLRRPHAALSARIAGRGESVIGVGRPRAGDLVRRETLVAGPVFRPRLNPRRLLARLDRV